LPLTSVPYTGPRILLLLTLMGMARHHCMLVVPIYFEDLKEYQRVLEEMGRKNYIDDDNANICFFPDEMFIVIDLIDKPRRLVLRKARISIEQIVSKASEIAANVGSVRINLLTGDIEISRRQTTQE